MASTDKKIANFLHVSSTLEEYLHEGGPLTPLQYQTIETTIMGLQTMLQSWTRKQRPEHVSRGKPVVSSRRAQGS